MRGACMSGEDSPKRRAAGTSPVRAIFKAPVSVIWRGSRSWEAGAAAPGRRRQKLTAELQPRDRCLRRGTHTRCLGQVWSG